MYWTFTTSLVRLIRSGQNLIWKDWLTGLIGRKGIKKRKKKTADDFVGLSFSCVLLFVYGPLANTRYRAPPPAIAGSLLVDDARKTNAAFSAALVFLLRSSHAYSLCDLGHFGFV